MEALSRHADRSVFCLHNRVLRRIVGMLLLVSVAAAAADKPNFIIINIDDLGYSDIGPYGSTVNRTPHLDRMAREGRKLTCFYAAPVCSPSRASLMTGCYPKRALSIPHVLFPGNDVGLHPDEVTIAELLKEAGYATGIVGKWHLGDQPPFLPTRQGFDDYFGLPYSNDMGPVQDGIKSNLGAPLPRPRGRGQPPLPLLRNETVLQRVLPDDQQALVERYTQEAVRFMWQHRDQPFLLYLPHSAVHFPLYPGKKFQGRSMHGLFGDWVEELDWSVGQIFTTLRQLGLDQKTLVIFTSDNGGAPVHGARNTPLRGGKGSTFEGGMRVPTIAWWPGKIPAGTETDAVTSMMDLLPTCVKLAGGTLPKDRRLDGGDIWPILAGAPNARTPHDNFYFFRGLKLQAVRSGPWKLHLGSGELFHLGQDISEADNVAARQPGVVNRLRGLAQQMDRDLGVDSRGPGCRPLGRAPAARPLIAHNGEIRRGFAPRTPHTGMGIMVGELTPSSALVQVRLTATNRLIDRDVPGAPGIVEFTLRTSERPAEVVSRQLIRAIPARDFIARAAFTKLRAGTEYVCTTRIGTDENGLRPGRPVASFRTLPGPDREDTVKFVVVTGMNYAKFHGDTRIDREQHVIENNTALPPAYELPDKHLGYPALETIRRLDPDFFVGTGDNVYYDTPDNPRAEKVFELRQKWHEQFVQPRYRQLFAKVATYWMVDDHDYRIDDGDNTGDHHPSPAVGRRMMLEQLPIAAQDDFYAKTYRTRRLNRDLQVWFPENRMHRSANALPDGPHKSIWGPAQKAWLMKTLQESTATFRLIVSPTPMVGPDDVRKTDNHTNHGGFRHERDEFFAWLKSNGLDKRVFLVCGDRHWQYHSIHPTGIEEFSCGALVDANSRPGRQPGDPQGTDPQGLIRQVYSQPEKSGGFLMITISRPADGNRAQLEFTHRDELGKVLNRHVKMADAGR